jgi:putative hydroxymethylpyrimidine transport system ATP-binding protein
VSPGILVRGLASRYGDETVFENLSFDIPAGEFTALLGPSGAGKTTLLKILAGLETPTAGTVEAPDKKSLAHRIAYMAQQDLLLPWLNALDNIMLGAKLRGEPKDAERAVSILDRVGLANQGKKLPAQLSGGQRSRIALARTLYEQRPVVLLDEPFAALDAITRIKIQNLAAELFAGRTVLFITHDPLEACRLGHRLLILSGQPARLSMPMSVPGPPPRAVDDPALLAMQAQLLKNLA